MSTPNEVLKIAKTQLGYNMWTDPARQRGIIGSKYGRWYRDYHGVTWAGGDNVAYCNIFVSWCLHKAGVKEPGDGYFAWTVRCYETYRNAGREVNKYAAKPGDLVFFDWEPGTGIDHIGICEVNLGSNGLQCIEGNTSGSWRGSQSNGGGVYRRARAWGNVRAVVRPFYTYTAKKKIVQKVHFDEFEELEMIRGFCYTTGKNTWVYCLFNPVSGWRSTFGQGQGRGRMGADYVNKIARYWNTGSWPTLSPGHASQFLKDLDRIAAKK